MDMWGVLGTARPTNRGPDTMANKYTGDAIALAEQIAPQLGVTVRFSGGLDGASHVVVSVGSSAKSLALPRSPTGVTEFERKLRAATSVLKQQNERHKPRMRDLAELKKDFERERVARRTNKSPRDPHGGD